MKDKKFSQQIIKKTCSTPEDIMHMVTSFSEVLGNAMDPVINETKIEYLERSVMMFLSCLDRVDICMRNRKGNPVWSVTFLYMCPMNISTVLKKYGCLQNL